MPHLAQVLKTKVEFRSQLLRWYGRNRREMPWRGIRDPYGVWVSEIMLQQTRVNAVLGHYRRFMERFPTVSALAAASEADVLATWSGLGYYRRARMMRLAAQEIAHEREGIFPKTAEDLQTLPGIGRYTAAAIASIAYDEPRAVVDGNVERVVGRMAGKALPQRAVWDFVQAVIGKKRPGDFNQAMMELGALVCTPVNPVCGRCPVKSFCRSQGRPGVAKLKSARKVAVLQYVFAQKGGRVLLVQRASKESLMAGMWELPGGASADEPVLKLRHAITTTDYRVEVRAGGAGVASAKMKWVPMGKISALPLTGLTRKVLVKLGAIARPG